MDWIITEQRKSGAVKALRSWAESQRQTPGCDQSEIHYWELEEQARSIERREVTL